MKMILDLFAGSGGASSGIRSALGRGPDVAVNHDPGAIALHEANFQSQHCTEDIFKVDIAKYMRGSDGVGLMWASPDCTQFSVCKAGKPRDRKSRVLPWSIYMHAANPKISPDVIICENVPEIQSWGPLDENDMPIPERTGEYYRKFISAMQSLGYEFDSRELCAADYGAYTIRKRWYAIFRKDGRPIVWPEQTNSKTHQNGLPGWLGCDRYLDFSNIGKSVFAGNKVPAEKSLSRFKRCLDKFVEKKTYVFSNKVADDQIIREHPEVSEFITCAFIAEYHGTSTGFPVSEPLHTITCSAAHFALTTAVLVKDDGEEYWKYSDSKYADTYRKYGLVNTPVSIDGTAYRMVDLYSRFLTVDEKKLIQGFDSTYVLDHDLHGNTYPLSQQNRRIGNSVVPRLAELLVSANVPYLAVPRISTETDGQIKFA